MESLQTIKSLLHYLFETVDKDDIVEMATSRKPLMMDHK